MTLSHAGYAKAQPVSDYQAQRRGGRGKAATAVKDEDFVDKLFVANTHDTLLCFSNRGKVYWLNVYELPQAGRGSRGKPIVNLLPLEEGERINAMLPIKEFDEQHFVFMATSARHRQEDAAVGVLAPARERHHRRRPAPTTTAWSAWRSPTAARDPAVHDRRQGDPLPRGGSAADGARSRRRARRAPRRRPARDRADRRSATGTS